MIKKLDLYIAKKYLGTFFFTATLFSLIGIVVDFSNRVDKFYGAEMTPKQIWLEYYPAFMPSIIGQLWPIFALISVVFVTSRLAKNAEVISILNAGVSYYRFLLPFFVSALIIATIHLFANHFFIPQSNFARNSMDVKHFGKNKDKGKNTDVHIFMSDNSKIFVRSYNKKDSSARKVRLESFRDGALVNYLKAERLELIKAPNTWRLKGITTRKISPDGSEELFFDPQHKIDTVLNLFHSDFVERVKEKDGLTTPELIAKRELINSKGKGNSTSLQIEALRRTSEAVTVIILTLIGVAVASRKVRGGMGLHLAIGIFLGSLFIFFSKFSFTFAQNDMFNPVFGVWLPNIAFGIVAIILIWKAQK